MVTVALISYKTQKRFERLTGLNTCIRGYLEGRKIKKGRRAYKSH
jgi:hypothetical protein